MRFKKNMFVADFSWPWNSTKQEMLYDSSPLTLHHPIGMTWQAEIQAVVQGSKPLSSLQVDPHDTGSQDSLNFVAMG